MSTSPQIPEAIRIHLPATDANQKFVQTEEGLCVVAGAHALFLLDESGIDEAGLWHEIQYASWDADTRKLTIVWIDPDRSPVVLTTVEENPAPFMKILTSRVDNVIVLSKQATTPSGAVITASVRRRVDGALFSTIIVRGHLSPAEEKQAEELETQVRSELGLSE